MNRVNYNRHTLDFRKNKSEFFAKNWDDLWQYWGCISMKW